REGGVVGLALDPARALVPALLAAWECGATVVLVPPAFGPAELAAVAEGLSPSLIVAAAPDAERLARSTGGAPAALAIDGLPPLALLTRASGEGAADLAGAALVKL